MEHNNFDSNLARTHCMNFGLIVGIMCSISFLLAVYARGSVLVAQTGNILAIMAFITAGRLIRRYRQVVYPIGFRQACRMSILTYFFASLITAAVQFIYFRFLDHGQVYDQMQQLLEMPEYLAMLQRLAGESDVKEIVSNALNLLLNPAQMTMQLMWMNLILSLILTIPTALIGITGRKK